MYRLSVIAPPNVIPSKADNTPTPTTQALRLGLLAGQALEQSDNPAIVRRNVQPLRVGLSKYPRIGLLSMDYIVFYRLARNAYLCIRKGEECSCLIIHHINLYHND